MTISKDRVKPSPMPDSWKLKEIFATGIVFGGYLAVMTVIFFWLMQDTDFFSVSHSLLISVIRKSQMQHGIHDKRAKMKFIYFSKFLLSSIVLG
jgi:hypothetical protein